MDNENKANNLIEKLQSDLSEENYILACNALNKHTLDDLNPLIVFVKHYELYMHVLKSHNKLILVNETLNFYENNRSAFLENKPIATQPNYLKTNHAIVNSLTENKLNFYNFIISFLEEFKMNSSIENSLKTSFQKTRFSDNELKHLFFKNQIGTDSTYSVEDFLISFENAIYFYEYSKKYNSAEMFKNVSAIISELETTFNESEYSSYTANLSFKVTNSVFASVFTNPENFLNYLPQNKSSVVLRMLVTNSINKQDYKFVSNTDFCNITIGSQSIMLPHLEGYEVIKFLLRSQNIEHGKYKSYTFYEIYQASQSSPTANEEKFNDQDGIQTESIYIEKDYYGLKVKKITASLENSNNKKQIKNVLTDGQTDKKKYRKSPGIKRIDDTMRKNFTKAYNTILGCENTLISKYFALNIQLKNGKLTFKNTENVQWFTV